MSDVFGAGAAVQGATTLAGTALQVGEEDKALTAEQRAAQSSARSLSQAGASAQQFLNPYVATGNTAESTLNANNALYSNVDNTYTNQAEGATNQANSLASSLANGTGITQQSIQNTPGFQAINALGQQGATNSAAARGLADSGAALKGASDYATTQAEGDYQNLYQDNLGAVANLNSVAAGYTGVNSSSQGNITNSFNRENALAGSGLSAAGSSVGNALTAAGASNAYSNQAAAAVAAGSVGIGNAASSGLNSLGNTASQYSLYNNLLNGGGSSATLSSGTSDTDPNFGSDSSFGNS